MQHVRRNGFVGGVLQMTAVMERSCAQLTPAGHFEGTPWLPCTVAVSTALFSFFIEPLWEQYEVSSDRGIKLQFQTSMRMASY